MRAEAERVARQQAEEARRRAEEEAEAGRQLQTAQARREEDVRLQGERQSLRAVNVAAGVQRAELSGRLDSSIKKCSAVLRRLRQLTEQSQSASSLLAELSAVNLSRYVSEVVAALLSSECVLRRKEDVDKLVRVCSLMHQRHDAFAAEMIDAIERVFPDVRGSSSGSRQQPGSKRAAAAAALASSSTSASADGGSSDEAVEEEERRRRSCLRVLVELCLVGVTDEWLLVVDVLADCMQRDRHDAAQSVEAMQRGLCAFSQLALLLSFLRIAGDEFLGITPRRSKQLYALLQQAEARADAPVTPASPASPPLLGCVPPEVRDRCRVMFEQYWALLSSRYLTLAGEARRRESRLLKREVMRGDVSEEERRQQKTLHDNVEKLSALLQQMADLLDRQPPQLPALQPADDEEDEQQLAGLEVVRLDADEEGEADSSSGSFDSEESRAFYTQLLDLTLVVPPMLLRDGAGAAEADGKAAAAGKGREGEEEEKERELKDGKEGEADSRRSRRRRRGREEAEEELSIEELERRLHSINEQKQQQDDDAGSASDPVHALVQQLRAVVSAEQVDALACRFAALNSRQARTRLLSQLLRLPRSAVHVLPFAARLCAILGQYHAELGELLVAALQDEFFRLLRRRDSDKKLEYKLKNAAFIAELVKFRLVSPGLLFRCWKACTLQLTADSVAVLCCLLDGCGRFLYCEAATRPRCSLYLEHTRRLKEADGGLLQRDRGLQLALDAAMEACVPDGNRAARRQRAVLHVMERYVRQLLYSQLSSKTVSKIAVRLRRLPWTTASAASKPTAAAAAAAAPAGSEATLLAASPAPPPPPDVHAVVLQCLSCPQLAAYSSLPALAQLASLLCAQHPTLLVPLVDRVLEEVRAGLELNSAAQQQQRIAVVRYVSQLCVAQLLEPAAALDTLYLLLLFPDASSLYDSFRLRLILTLLDGISPMLQTGRGGAAATAQPLRRRVQRFLLYLLRHVQQKEWLSFDVEQQLHDTLQRLGEQRLRTKTAAQLQQEISKREEEDRRAGHGEDALGIVGLDNQSAAAAAEPQQQSAMTAAAEEEDDEQQPDEEAQAVDAEDDAMDEEAEGDEQQDEGGHDEGEEADEQDGDDDALEEEEDEDDEEEDDVWNRRRRSALSAEDASFERELERVLADSVEQRRSEARQAAIAPVESLLMTHGIQQHRRSALPDRRRLASVGEGGGAAEDAEAAGAESRQVAQQHLLFRLLTRDGKRAAGGGVVELHVPVDSDLAVASIENERSMREERDDVKRLVLAGLEREERERDRQEQRGGSQHDRRRHDDAAQHDDDDAAGRGRASAGGGGQSGGRGGAARGGRDGREAQSASSQSGSRRSRRGSRLDVSSLPAVIH